MKMNLRGRRKAPLQPRGGDEFDNVICERHPQDNPAPCGPFSDLSQTLEHLGQFEQNSESLEHEIQSYKAIPDESQVLEVSNQFELQIP